MAYKQVPGASPHGHEVSVYCPQCGGEYHINIFAMCRQKRLEPCDKCKANGTAANPVQVPDMRAQLPSGEVRDTAPSDRQTILQQ